MLKGKHLIAGEWVGGDQSFTNEPISGEADSFAVGTIDLVDRTSEASEAAFWSFCYSTRAERAAFLREIAIEIDARGDTITAMGVKETGLPEALRPAQQYAAEMSRLEDPGRGLPRENDGRDRSPPLPSQAIGDALQVALTQAQPIH